MRIINFPFMFVCGIPQPKLKDYNTQFKGSDLVPLLIGVFLRFRERKYIIPADIAEMFHQIQVNINNEDSKIFLGRKSPDL